MTRPGIEPMSPGPLANTLTAGPMSRFIYIYTEITCSFAKASRAFFLFFLLRRQIRWERAWITALYKWFCTVCENTFVSNSSWQWKVFESTNSADKSFFRSNTKASFSVGKIYFKKRKRIYGKKKRIIFFLFLCRFIAKFTSFIAWTSYKQDQMCECMCLCARAIP